jgi:hypothetical protein
MCEISLDISVSEIGSLIQALEEARRWYGFMIITKQKFQGIEELSQDYNDYLRELNEIIEDLRRCAEVSDERAILDDLLCAKLAVAYSQINYALIQVLNARQETVSNMRTPVSYQIVMAKKHGYLIPVKIPIFSYDPNGKWVLQANAAMAEEVGIWTSIQGIIGELPQRISARSHERHLDMHFMFGSDPFSHSQDDLGLIEEILESLGGMHGKLFIFHAPFHGVHEDHFSSHGIYHAGSSAIGKSEIIFHRRGKLPWYQQQAAASLERSLRKQEGGGELEEEWIRELVIDRLANYPPPGANLWENRPPRFLSKLGGSLGESQRCFRYRPPRFSTRFGAKSGKRK